MGPAGRSRPPGAGALPPRRDVLEGLVPEGVRGRRLPRDQARRRHRPPEGPLRPQQEAEEGQEDQRGEADAVRAAHQLEDPRSSTATSQARQGAGALPGRAEDLEQGGRGLEDHRQGRGGARGPRPPTRSPARPSTWPRRSTRTSCGSSSPRASTSSSPPSTTPRRRPRPRRRRPRSRARSSPPTSTRRPRGSATRATSTSRSSR